MAQPAISRRSEQFNIRLPDGLRDSLKIQAALNRRSMNAEIVLILEKNVIETETADRSGKSASAV
ncbi:Arc family DNA-binding protein [Aureimonas flava]|uniref:Arc family DNA-binding protein n=1 Tax=Aureimonas flava TaxID=2320271 RepID=UPI001AEC7C93|nr:Arc family DNA-binding protein [Aureimonas flava]